MQPKPWPMPGMGASPAAGPEGDTRFEAATKIHDLEQHVRQLQQEANNAGALEYRCEGLQQEKQQLLQQLQQLRGNIAQMQSTLHQERIQRQQHQEAAQKSERALLQAQEQTTSLQTSLKLAEQRLTEAEEEQIQTEQRLNAQLAEAAAAHHSMHSGAPQHSHPSQGTSTSTPQLLHHDAPGSALPDQAQRQESSDLQSALDSANAALASTQHQLSLAHAQIARLEQANSQQMAGLNRAEAAEQGSTDQDFPGLQKLQGQVASLKGSRDKLLQEVDRQSLEIARLAAENAALEQGLEREQSSAAAWEVQAQDNLSQAEQLKSLLEESAFWEAEAEADPAHQHGEPPKGEDLQKQVLQEKSRAVTLEVQVKALCLELARARDAAGMWSQSFAPAIEGISNRLAQLLQLQTVPR